MQITRLAGLLSVGLLCASVTARAEELQKDWRFSTSLNGGVLLGLSDGASDYGFSVGGAVRF